MLKRWIALSPGYMNIQRISISETNCAIHWIDIYPVDSVIHHLNNWGQIAQLVFPNTYPLDIDLSSGEYYPSFEQLGPLLLCSSYPLIVSL